MENCMSNYAQFGGGGGGTLVGGVVTLLEGSSAMPNTITTNGQSYAKTGSALTYSTDHAALIANGQATTTNQISYPHPFGDATDAFFVYSPTVDFCEKWWYSSRSGNIYGPQTAGGDDYIVKGNVSGVPYWNSGEASREAPNCTMSYSYVTGNFYFLTWNITQTMVQPTTSEWATRLSFQIWNSTDGYNWSLAGESDVRLMSYNGYTFYNLKLIGETTSSVIITYIDYTTGPNFYQYFQYFEKSPDGTLIYNRQAEGAPTNTALYPAFYPMPTKDGIMYGSGDSTAYKVWFFTDQSYGLPSVIFNSATTTSLNEYYYFKGKYYGIYMNAGAGLVYYKTSPNDPTMDTTTVAASGIVGITYDPALGRLYFWRNNTTHRYTTDGITYSNLAGTAMGAGIYAVQYPFYFTSADTIFWAGTSAYSLTQASLSNTSNDNMMGNDIVYWNSYYWTCTGHGCLFRSTNLTNWTMVAKASENFSVSELTVKIKVVNNNLFFMFAQGAKLAYYTSGSTINVVTPNTGPSAIYDVTYIGTNYVIGGTTGTGNAAYNTTLGASGWTTLTLAGGGVIVSLESGGGNAVAVNSTCGIAYSTNGSSWTTSGAALTYSVSGLSYISSKFYLVHVAQNDYNGFTISESTNGVSWTTTATITGAEFELRRGASGFNQMVYNSTTAKYYLFANNGNYLSSSNLTTWTATPVVYTGAYPSATRPSGIAKLTVANGKTLVTASALSYVSVDEGTSITIIKKVQPLLDNTINYVRYK